MIETIKHFFGGGVYLKTWRIKDGACIPQHTHNFEHLSAVFSGCVMVEVDGKENQIYYSPDAIVIEAGLIHTFTAVNGDAVIGCIHALNDALADLDAADLDKALVLDGTEAIPQGNW